jgi:hypothetical protein
MLKCIKEVGFMNDYLIYAGIAIVLIVILVIVLKTKNRVKEPSVDMDELNKLFNKNDISKIDFIRNKIVISFKDISLFNVESLHGTYAKGITVVGDKIKFYVSDDQLVNEEVYKSIKSFIER